VRFEILKNFKTMMSVQEALRKRSIVQQ